MTAQCEAGRWRGGTTVACVVSLLVLAGLLLTLCAVDVPAGQSEHHDECWVELAPAATGAPAVTPDLARGAAGESGVVRLERWHGIAVSPDVALRGSKAFLQQPRAPPSLAIS